MKYLTLQLNENTRIDINNSIWGKETILYNNEIVSEKTSVLGCEHTFEKVEDGRSVVYKVSVGFDWMRGVVYHIYRDDKKVFTNHGNSMNSWQLGPAFIFLCFAIAGFFGVTLYQGDQSALKVVQIAFTITFFAKGMQLLIAYNNRLKK